MESGRMTCWNMRQIISFIECMKPMYLCLPKEEEEEELLGDAHGEENSSSAPRLHY